jgi:curved DNA-binding protein CbpA
MEAFRKKAMEVHPDKGGTSEMFNRVQTAYQQGMSNLAG